jgi:hypothetical protein
MNTAMPDRPEGGFRCYAFQMHIPGLASPFGMHFRTGRRFGPHPRSEVKGLSEAMGSLFDSQ